MRRLVPCAVSLAFVCLTALDLASDAIAENKLPQVNFQADPRRGFVPLTVHFTNTSNDADGTLVGFRWDFGDGTTSAEENPVHTYMTTGKFDVTLSVTD